MTDNKYMDMNETIEIVKAVLMDYRIIGIVVAALLYISIVNYVVRYRKKPPKIRRMKIVSEQKKPADQNASGGQTEDSETSEDLSSGQEETAE